MILAVAVSIGIAGQLGTPRCAGRVSGQAVDLRSSATTSASIARAPLNPTTTLTNARRTHRPATPSQVTMLLLDYQNVLIQSVLTERFSG